jgi:hypothetical protein
MRQCRRGTGGRRRSRASGARDRSRRCLRCGSGGSSVHLTDSQVGLSIRLAGAHADAAERAKHEVGCEAQAACWALLAIKTICANACTHQQLTQLPVVLEDVFQLPEDLGARVHSPSSLAALQKHVPHRNATLKRRVPRRDHKKPAPRVGLANLMPRQKKKERKKNKERSVGRLEIIF